MGARATTWLLDPAVVGGARLELVRAINHVLLFGANDYLPGEVVRGIVFVVAHLLVCVGRLPADLADLLVRVALGDDGPHPSLLHFDGRIV